MIRGRSIGWVLFIASAVFCFGTVRAEDIAVTPTVVEGTAWYDAEAWPVENKAWSDTERYFARIPARARERVTPNVWNLSQHSAGELVRFRTNAASISVKYKLFSASLAMPHMPATGVSGLDLYARDADGVYKWVACTQPKAQEATDGLISGLDGAMRDYVLYLPLYNGVDHLEIGVPEGAEFHAVAPRTERPILYYGTSIAHGGCCSRPGNAFSAMLSRRLDLPVINLGFSGSARMEPELAELFAELDPCLYVFDASPNMQPELIDERGVKFVQIIRDKHPETPILLVEDRCFSNSWILPAKADFHKRNHEALRRVYDHFIAAGDKNIYYLSAENLIGEKTDFDSTMDGSHLNDLGMYRMTDSLEAAIRPILGK